MPMPRRPDNVLSNSEPVPSHAPIFSAIERAAHNWHKSFPENWLFEPFLAYLNPINRPSAQRRAYNFGLTPCTKTATPFMVIKS